MKEDSGKGLLQMHLIDRIVVDPKILTGKPVVRGTRLSVDFVLELLASGWTHTQILASYPHLSEEDIRACLAYASQILPAYPYPTGGPNECPLNP